MASSVTDKVAYLTHGASITDAQIVGFDLDHCLARYTRPVLTHLIFESLVGYLVPQRGWPESLLTADPRPDLNCKGVLFETSSGNLLRLDQNGRVLQGFHGTTRLTNEAITAKYGSGPWQDFERLQNMERHENFLLFLTYFDMPAASLLAYMVDAVDAGWSAPAHLGEADVPAHSTDHADGHNTPAAEAAKTAAAASEQHYGHLIPDLFRSFNYVFDNVEGFTPRRGGFFSALQDNPKMYLLQRPALKQWLQERSQRKQQAFLATNSCLAFAHFLLQRIFGDDWKDCFDCVVMDARKGAWFNVQSPWLQPDGERERGGGAATQVTWPSKQVLVNGSAQLVDTVHDALAGDSSVGLPLQLHLAEDGSAAAAASVQRAEGLPVGTQQHDHTIAESLVDAMEDKGGEGGGQHPPRPAVWYAGDHLHGDVAAAKQHGWNTIAVVEELAFCKPDAAAVAAAGMLCTELPTAAAGSALPAEEAEERQTQLQQAASGCGSAWGSNWFEFPPDVHCPEGSIPYYSRFTLEQSSLIVADVADITAHAQKE